MVPIIQSNKTKRILDEINITKTIVKYPSIIGIGESSHGDIKTQQFRLKLLKIIIKHSNYKKIIICFEALDSTFLIIRNLKDNISRKNFDKIINSTKLSLFMKEPEYIDIIYYCYKMKYSIYGVDTPIIRTNDFKSINKKRDNYMNKKLIEYSNNNKNLVFFLAHNNHIALLYTPFRGISIATHSNVVQTWIENKSTRRKVNVNLGDIQDTSYRVTGIGDKVYIYDDWLYDPNRGNNYDMMISI